MSNDGRLIQTVDDHVGGRDWNAYDLTAATGAPTLKRNVAAVIDNTGHYHVFAYTVGGNLIQIVDDGVNGHNWNAYDLTTATGGPTLAGAPVVVKAADGRLHVFATSTSSRLIQTVDDHVGGRNWNAYDLTTATGGPLLKTRPAAVLAGGRLYVFTIASNSRLMLTIDDHLNGANWHTYDISAQSGGAVFSSAPAALVTSGTSVNVFAANTSGHLIHTVNDGQNGRTWNGYDITLAIPNLPLLHTDPPTSVVGADGMFHVFGTTPGGRMVEVADTHPSPGVNWQAFDFSQAIAEDGLLGSESTAVVGPDQHVHVFTGRCQDPASCRYGGTNLSVDQPAEISTVRNLLGTTPCIGSNQVLWTGLSVGDQKRIYPADSSYNIEFVRGSGFSNEEWARVEPAARAAAESWQSTIARGAADFPRSNGVWVDDLIVTLQKGFTGSHTGTTSFQERRPACLAESRDLPLAATITYSDQGTLPGIVDKLSLHELGHAIGIAPTLWDAFGLTSSFGYFGVNARHQAGDLPAIPLDADGMHWSGIAYPNDVMAAVVLTTQISNMDIGALQDIGYEVIYPTGG